MKQEQSRIEVLDFLRGIASLGVALHHFFNILDPGVLSTMGFYGQLGVQVFFVISGFVIPYSLHRGGYRISDYPVFVLKRVVRLDPPYVVTIALIIALGVFSWYMPFQKDFVFEVSVTQVLLHFAYVNVFFGYPWLNDVFWTLAIEFQYYLLLGLVFPLLFSRRAAVRLATLAALGALSFLLPSSAYIFYFIFLFIMGMVTCQYRVGLIGAKQCAALLAAAVVCSMLTVGAQAVGAVGADTAGAKLYVFLTAGLPSTLAGLLATCAILFLRVQNAVFRFLGQISYSLYLVHSPVGRRALNVMMRASGWESLGGKLVLIAAATAVSIFAAYLLYRFVERPSQVWSAALRYRRDRRRSVRPAPTTEEMEQLNPAL